MYIFQHLDLRAQPLDLRIVLALELLQHTRAILTSRVWGCRAVCARYSGGNSAITRVSVTVVIKELRARISLMELRAVSVIVS